MAKLTANDFRIDETIRRLEALEADLMAHTTEQRLALGPTNPATSDLMQRLSYLDEVRGALLTLQLCVEARSTPPAVT